MKKSIKNVTSGILGQFIAVAFGIIIPRLVILSLGSESNGLLSSINTVISYLNLLEAGIGTVALQALYGPVAKEKKSEINAIIAAVKNFYRRTGKLYALGILGIAFIYPFVVESEIPIMTIILVIFFSGMPQVINFYFQGKYKTLLQADGRNYILTNLQTATSVFTSVGKVILLNNGFGLCAIQFMYCVVSLAQMIFLEGYMKKSYGWIDLTVQPDVKALEQSNSVLVHQISGLVFNSTDTLILSLICGLKAVSVYSVYTMLLGMVSTLIQNINNGIVYLMGQTFNTDREKYLKLHDAYEVYNMSLTFSLYAVAGIFILPFIRLYTAGAEISYVDKRLAHLFIATYLLENGRTACIKAIHYAGHFQQTRWHAVVEMTVNLVVSVACASCFGIYGVLIGTVAALLFRSNVIILYASKYILNRKPACTYYHWGINILLYLAATTVSNLVLRNIVLDSYMQIVFWAIIAGFVWIPAFFAVNSMLNKNIFLFAVSVLRGRNRPG